MGITAAKLHIPVTNLFPHVSISTGDAGIPLPEESEDIFKTSIAFLFPHNFTSRAELWRRYNN